MQMETRDASALMGKLRSTDATVVAIRSRYGAVKHEDGRTFHVKAPKSGDETDV